DGLLNRNHAGPAPHTADVTSIIASQGRTLTVRRRVHASVTQTPHQSHAEPEDPCCCATDATKNAPTIIVTTARRSSASAVRCSTAATRGFARAERASASALIASHIRLHQWNRLIRCERDWTSSASRMTDT